MARRPRLPARHFAYSPKEEKCMKTFPNSMVLMAMVSGTFPVHA
jgi:hypothetical protein